MDYYAERIDYASWNIYKWHHAMSAVIRRDRIDLYEQMLAELIQHRPDLLSPVANWLERDGQNPRSGLIID
jgi:hypothetical protein